MRCTQSRKEAPERVVTRKSRLVERGDWFGGSAAAAADWLHSSGWQLSGQKLLSLAKDRVAGWELGRELVDVDEAMEQF